MNGQHNYNIIDRFFDAFDLPSALKILSNYIRTADEEKTWSFSHPADLLYFTEWLLQLLEAVDQLTAAVDYKQEIILEKQETNCWMLTEYHNYCGWQTGKSAWDFIPRHLSKKEFLNPYKALHKCMKYRNLLQWKETIKDLTHYALSPAAITGFEDGTSILGTWIHLHKLIEAAHLIEVRTADKPARPRRKWSGTLQESKNRQHEL